MTIGLSVLAVLLLIASAVMLLRRSPGEDHDDDEGGGGGGGLRRGDRPRTPPSGPEGREPDWWPQFERDLAAYMAEASGRRALTRRRGA